MTEERELLKRITISPRVMVGKPVIRNTRITVDHLLRLLASRMTEAEILAEYPWLEPEDVQAALLYAAAVVANEDVYPLTASS